MNNDFRELQYAFARHLRDPDNSPAPQGIEDRRIGIYRDLFFNNLRSLLATTFPVLREILGDARWAELVRAFFREHPSRTPLFMQVPREFVEWLNALENPGPWPPFMSELAHYEWVELDVSIDEHEIDTAQTDASGNILDQVLVLSPVARVLAYQYPVHRIGPAFQPEQPDLSLTFLAVYRRRNDDVRFTEINALTARLLELTSTHDNRNGRQLLEQLAAETRHPNAATVVEAGREILETLLASEIVFVAGK